MVGSITYILGYNPPVSLRTSSSFTYNGEAGGDSLTVLYANGDPLIRGSIVFNGGTGSNTLNIDAAGLPMRTVTGRRTAGDPQTVLTATSRRRTLTTPPRGRRRRPRHGRSRALAGLSANARFVEALYLDELGRVGDTTNALDAGAGSTRSTAAPSRRPPSPPASSRAWRRRTTWSEVGTSRSSAGKRRAARNRAG